MDSKPRYFTVGELFGPFPCEQEGCNHPIAWTIKLTAEENNSLPEQQGPYAVQYIFENKLGTSLCKICIAKEGHENICDRKQERFNG